MSAAPPPPPRPPPECSHQASTASSGSECSPPDLSHKECPNIYQIECQKVCYNRCQIECQNLCQKECQIECQNRYAIYTSRWHVRNYVCQKSVSRWGSLEESIFLPQLIWIAFLVDEVLMHKSRMAHSSPKLQTLQADHCVVHL